MLLHYHEYLAKFSYSYSKLTFIYINTDDLNRYLLLIKFNAN